FQGSYRNVIRNSHKLSVDCVTGQQLRLKQRDFVRQVGLQIDQIGFENRRPNQIDRKKVGAGAAVAQELARELEVVESTLRSRNISKANACFLGELLGQRLHFRELIGSGHGKVGIPQCDGFPCRLTASNQRDKK